jgi:hypothetical protein
MNDAPLQKAEVIPRNPVFRWVKELFEDITSPTPALPTSVGFSGWVKELFRGYYQPTTEKSVIVFYWVPKRPVARFPLEGNVNGPFPLAVPLR